MMLFDRSWKGLLFLILASVLVFIGCGDGSSELAGGNRGVFTLTDIPATYNGNYVYFEAVNDNVYIVGCQSVDVSKKIITLVRISNGKVNIPLWLYNTANNSVSKYSGNDTFTQYDNVGVGIFSSVTLPGDNEQLADIYFSSVSFSNGSLLKSANDGFISISEE